MMATTIPPKRIIKNFRCISTRASLDLPLNPSQTELKLIEEIAERR
jgi:hypothetical protein